VIATPDPRSALVRGVRALVLTVSAVGLAGAAHSLVDACLNATGLLLAAGLCWPAAVWVLGRRRHVPALVAWLAGAQVVTHLLLEATCGPSGRALPPRALAVHAVGCAISALLLHRADSGLWAAHLLLRAVDRLRPRRPVLLAVPLAPRTRVETAVPPIRPRAVTRTPYVRRGPPSSAAA
jgi:hypothetical protein